MPTHRPQARFQMLRMTLVAVLSTLCLAGMTRGQEVTFQPEPVFSKVEKGGRFQGLKFSHHDRRLWNDQRKDWDIPSGHELTGGPLEPSDNKSIFSGEVWGRRVLFVDTDENRLLSWGGVTSDFDRPLPEKGRIKSLQLLSNRGLFAAWMVDPQQVCLGAIYNNRSDRYVKFPFELGKVEISPTGKTVVATLREDDKSLVVLDLENGEEKLRIKQKSVIASLAISPDDRYVATGSFDNAVRIYDLKTGKQVHVLKKHKEGKIFLGSAVYDVAFSRDSAYLASGGHDGRVVVWDVEKGSVRFEAKVMGEPIIWSVAIAKDWKMVACGFEDVGAICGVAVWRFLPEEK